MDPKLLVGIKFKHSCDKNTIYIIKSYDEIRQMFRIKYGNPNTYGAGHAQISFQEILHDFKTGEIIRVRTKKTKIKLWKH